jgi:hypothetical protein
MIRSAIFLLILILIAGLTACVNADDEFEQNAFSQSFSIGEHIEANEAFLIAKHTVSSGSESVPPESFFQLYEVATVEIDPEDVPDFMGAVRSSIEMELYDSGAEIVGRGGDVEGRGGNPDDLTYFSFRYSDEGAGGVINVWGVRGEGTNYTLLVLVTEG